MRVTVLSSTPASPTEGSGTFVATAGLVEGLTRLGVDVTVRRLGRRTGFHTFDRWRYNLGVVLAPPDADVVLGIDLDGFLWSRCRRVAAARDGARAGAPRRPRVVVSLKGVIADERRHERGWVRVLLGVQARWERSNARRADVVTAPSRYAAATAARFYGVDPDGVRVLPEPIDVAGWRARLQAAEPRPRAGRTVLAVARMYPRKRLVDLLDAARLLAARIPDLTVRIVGSGPEYAALRARHVETGLGPRIRFLGDVSAHALAVEYVSADLFCLPSVQEAFGIAFAEAMIAGLPIVACRAGAVPEVVEDGRTGLLVPPENPNALAAAIEALMHDEERRRELGRAGTRRVEAFDLERVARDWLAVLAG